MGTCCLKERKLVELRLTLRITYHSFGLDGRAVSAVGDDKLGAEILENFYEKNLHSMIEKVPYPTGTVQVELDAEGVPCYDIKEGVAWDNIPYTPALEGLAKQTTAVCLVLWHSEAWFPEKQSTSSWMPCRKIH